MSLIRIAFVFLIVSGLTIGCSSTPSKKDDPSDEKLTEQQQDQPERSAQDFVIQGNSALDEGDFDQATRHFDEALSRDPDRWDIHMNKAIAHSAQQEFSEAVAAIDEALSRGGDEQPEVYFNLGNIYQNRGLYAQSVKAYRTSLAMRGEPHIDTLVNLAAGLAMMRVYDDAEAAYEEVRELAPDDPRPYVGLGLVHHLRGQYEVAEQYYDQAHDIDPDHAQAWFNKAALQTTAGDEESAIQSYRRYLEVAPDGPYAKRATNNLEALEKKE
jgi:tetratricopeptide (TPR) repeat protein